MERAPSTHPEPDPRESALAKTAGIPSLAARVLLARGIDDPDLARAYLRPDLRTLADPFGFTHMKRAVDRIKQAIRNGERIVVHGDYDADGITGTVLLVKFFQAMSADVQAFIPAREDGYSITEASVKAVVEGGFKLLISVDNGTNAIDAIDAIQAAGCDVVVTDHHGTSEGLARAHTILNPRLPDAGYPDRDLAGVGVAFKLATAVAQSFSSGRIMSQEFRNYLVEAMAYVALGTVADVAPLRGENRVMVHHGLRALAASRNPGIRALIDSAGLGDRSPDVEDISFRIAPLINAAGRMGSALEAVELLMAPGYQEAQNAASALEKHNLNRRKVEKEVVEAAMRMAQDSDDEVIVLGAEGWHRGVLGIVASRLAESLHKPTLLLSFESGFGRGSGRSVDGFHLRDALAQCSDLLLRYGGHHAAVGLEIEQSKLDDLRVAINAAAKSTPRNVTPLKVDGRADFSELDPRDVRKLDMLGPFGMGNRRPVFVTEDVKIVGNPTVDKRGQDLRFRVVKDGVLLPVRLHRGVQMFEDIRGSQDPVTISYSPRLSTWTEDGPVYLHTWHLAASTHNRR
ncbi:MAG: single-stranded-DNA-specific exonuclease RecJ [Planctomycetota bacterium]|nr:single-stranded-DNA-specific exonuclease RecJ [Planctomycetota bacterium]